MLWRSITMTPALYRQTWPQRMFHSRLHGADIMSPLKTNWYLSFKTAKAPVGANLSLRCPSFNNDLIKGTASWKHLSLRLCSLHLQVEWWLSNMQSNPCFLPHSLSFTKNFLPTFPVNLAQLVPQPIDNQDPSSDPIVTNGYWPQASTACQFIGIKEREWMQEKHSGKLTLENPPFEDALPIENRNINASLPKGTSLSRERERAPSRPKVCHCVGAGKQTQAINLHYFQVIFDNCCNWFNVEWCTSNFPYHEIRKHCP